MPDPLTGLRLSPTPLEPRPAFTAELRGRIETALGHPPPPAPTTGGTMPADHPAYVPERLHAVTPYLCCDGAQRAIDWYVDVFAATVTGDVLGMDGSVLGVGADAPVGHAELRMGDSVLMLSDEWAAGQVFSPTTLGGSPVALVVYVPDVDATFSRALAAGAQELRPVADQPYGMRAGWLHDPFGHRWNVATPLDDGS